MIERSDVTTTIAALAAAGGRKGWVAVMWSRGYCAVLDLGKWVNNTIGASLRLVECTAMPSCKLASRSPEPQGVRADACVPGAKLQ